MRIKRGFASHRKHKKLLSQVKGYRMTRHKLVKVAKEAYLHAGKYAYSGRKKKKSDFRKLWITRITQALLQKGVKYSLFISKMKKAHILLDRKILSNLLLTDKEAFDALVDKTNKI